MAAKERIFFAGVGTTFAILAIGFGGGYLMANSTLDAPTSHDRLRSEPLPVARVVLPPSSEPALKPTAPTVAAAPVIAPSPPVAAPTEQAQAQIIPVENRIQPSGEVGKQADRAEQRKAAAQRDRRKRYAERNARREAMRAKQQQELQQQEPQQQEARRPMPGVMAFDDEQPRSSGFFGN